MTIEVQGESSNSGHSVGQAFKALPKVMVNSDAISSFLDHPGKLEKVDEDKYLYTDTLALAYCKHCMGLDYRL